jgi:hypothetical protein
MMLTPLQQQWKPEDNGTMPSEPAHKYNDAIRVFSHLGLIGFFLHTAFLRNYLRMCCNKTINQRSRGFNPRVIQSKVSAP